MLAAAPAAALWLRGDGRLESRGVTLRSPDFLDALDEWWQAQRRAPAADARDQALPFRGGWIVYLSYEMADRIEPGLHLPQLPADALCAMAMRVPAALVYDHANARCQLIVEAGAADAGAQIERALAALPAADPQGMRRHTQGGRGDSTGARRFPHCGAAGPGTYRPGRHLPGESVARLARAVG